tara:strand:+ start:2091 stop:2291 length:201 start_codon:yes stop_codon:yes gene_type:complete
MQEKFLRPKQAAKKAGISISHLYNLIARNDFPIPIKMSKGITVFLESDIDEWILQKVDNSRNNYLR